MLAAFLWLKFDTNTKQQVVFLDEVVVDAYEILQSEKKLSGKTFPKKEVPFNDVFDSNEQISDGEPNLLSDALMHSNLQKILSTK